MPAAWDILKTKPETVDITATVPVNTVLSGFLHTPGIGTGIYDREGVTVGSPYTRTYTITRTNGGSNPRTFNLSWVGNDGTFSTPASITWRRTSRRRSSSTSTRLRRGCTRRSSTSTIRRARASSSRR